MKLRNGKTYNFTIQYKKRHNRKIINIDKHMICCICMNKYYSGELICSCSIKNINKHSFHKKCIDACKKATRPAALRAGHYKCPYCYSKIEKFNFVKVI